MGRVTDLNRVKGYVELESFPAGTSRVVIVTDKTEMTKPGQITAAELQAGDVVRVSGTPIQLEAASIDVQPPREAPEAGPPDAAATGVGEAAGDETEGIEDEEPTGAEWGASDEESESWAERRGRPQRSEGSVSISGVVESLDPLVIALPNGLSITVALVEHTTITKPMPATMQDVNEGDFVWASGERNPDELLEAERMRILAPETAMSLVSRWRSPMMERSERRRPFGGYRDGPRRGGGPGRFGEGPQREGRNVR